MKKQIDRCMGCMNEKRYSGPCEICGYIDNDAYPADCLAPRTFLNDRYILGKLISRGGDSAVYLAFDTKVLSFGIRRSQQDAYARAGDRLHNKDTRHLRG